MRCAYCGVEVVNYPDNGICVHCGGKLPERPAGIRCPACGTFSSGNFCAHCGCSLTGAAAPAQPVCIPAEPVGCSQPALACSKCHSTRILRVNRGFSWGLALLGFFLIPVFGFLLGFCGAKKPRLLCAKCRRKWKPD